MFLVIALLVSSVILTLLSGVAIFVGSHNDDRQRALVFLVAAICAAVWTLGIIFFITATSLALAWSALVAVFCVFPFLLASLFAFVGWNEKFAHAPLAFTALAAVALVFALSSDHTLLFGPIALSTNGNEFTLLSGWFFWVYALYCIVVLAATVSTALISAHRKKRKALRLGSQITCIFVAVAGATILLTDLILPAFGNCSLIWLGPIAFSIALLAFLYTILRYRLISVSSRALLFLSIVSIVIVGVNLYMLIFTTVLTKLFKVATPGAEVLALNFVMILVMLLLLPVLNELYAYLRSLITVSEVNLAYVVKKLNRLATNNTDLDELSNFLADHLHFTYIGLSIHQRLYGSESLPISASELKSLSELEHKPRSIWLAPDDDAEALYLQHQLSAVAELRNGKGKTFGLILVGKPIGKTKIDRRDLIQIEMIINLVATIVDSERHPKAR